MVRLFLIVCFIPLLLQSQDLENAIYSEVDRLSQQPSLKLLHNVEAKLGHFSSKSSTPNQYIALVVLRCQMGFQYTQFNGSQHAIEHYENAWSLYSSKHLTGYDMIEYCLKPLGNLYTKTGAYPLAEQTINTYINLAEKQNNKIHRLSGLLNLAIVNHSVGNFKSAVNLIEQALNEEGIPVELKQRLESNLANSLIAQNKLDSAKQVISKTNNAVSLLTKAQLAKEESRFEDALHLLQASEEFLIASPNFLARDLAKLYIQKADVFLLKNNPDSAKTHFKKAFEILLPLSSIESLYETDLYPENTFLAIFDGLAALEKNTEQALIYYDWSFYVSQLLQQNLTDQQSQFILAAEDRLRSERCIDLLFNEYSKNEALVYAQLAFEYAEQTKAQILQSRLNTKARLEQFPRDSLLIRRQKLQQKQEQLISNLIKSQMTFEAKNLDSLQSALRKNTLELKSVQKHISTRFPDTELQSPSIEQIQERLKSDDARFVEYVYGKHAVYQFQIDSQGHSFIKIEKNDPFVNTLKSFLGFFEASSNISKDVSAYTTVASRLFKLLKFPEIEEDSNWVIVPDGLLNFVPFDALLTKDSKSYQFEAMPFLIKEVTLFYQNSADLYLKSYEAKKEDSKILGVFPAFSNTSEELKYSLEEAKTIKAFDNSTLLLHENATKKNFVKQAFKYDILHLSTHATGGNLYTPAQLAFYDEPLLLNELYSLNLNTDLVILSACETAIGKLQLGEGAMSLSRGFQYAGAKQLLVTQWQVNDKSTADIVQSFYKFYDDGLSVGHAIKQAKLEYLNNSNIKNTSKSPYYWASFIALSHPAKTEDSLSWLWWLFFTSVIMLALFFFKRKG